MTDKQSNTAFDDKVKDVLKNYETSNASANWARMESMLDAAPQAHSFKKIEAKIVIKLVAAAAIVATSYLIYSVIPSQPTTDEIKNTDEQKTTEEQTEEIKQESIPHVEQQPEKQTEQDVQTEATAINPEKKETNINQGTIKVEKTKINNQPKEFEETKPKKIITMGNEPVFGDMLDSSKGIVGKTQEKEEIKKAAKEQTKTNTGWNTFLFSPVAPDSIRKNREKEKSDSLKQR